MYFLIEIIKFKVYKKVMLSAFLSGLYLFFFIFAWYIVLMFILNAIKVFALKTGKIEVHKWSSPLVGIAISYIIMAFVIGL